MDITGRVAGYKGRDVRCPGCAEAMSVERVGEGDVDVCAACGGVWLDWFDGEPREMVTRVVEGGVVGRPSAPDALRAEARAIGACPRCGTQLVSERYATADAVLLRCESCAGSFVSRTAAEALAALAPEESPPPSETSGRTRPLEPAAWRRMLTALKSKLGL